MEIRLIGGQTPPLPERQFDALQDDVMDFAPLPEGRLP
jgi:hypothetical protein